MKLDRVLLAITLVGAQYVEQADYQLAAVLLPPPASAGVTGVYRHAHLHAH